MQGAFPLLAAIAAVLVTLSAGAQEPANLCPNPGAEEAAEGDAPADWYAEGGEGIWADDQMRSGKRSFKIVRTEPGRTVGWTSAMIPVPEPGMQFVLSVWARMENVTGNQGAFIGLYHTDENGERIGQSGTLSIGGAGESAATEDWKEYVTVSGLTPQVKGVRVNARLYGAQGTVWFDDIQVRPHSQEPLARPRPLRRGLRLEGEDGLAIVAAEGSAAAAERLRSSLQSKGCEAPVISHDEVDLTEERRDLIILGNLATSRAVEFLYKHSYTYEDLYFPGAGGYVLRPLIDPLGMGSNLLVVGASDQAGLEAGTEALLAHLAAAGEVLEIPLTVETGEGYRGIAALPWFTGGPRREMAPAVAFLKSGDMEHAREYREIMLKQLGATDEELFGADASLHLHYVTQTMSWDLMESCGVFSDAERLEIANYLLKVMRSPQGYGYSGLRAGLATRENHATRAARAFYYGWRHFSKYYSDDLGIEPELWRRKLRDFWAACFASSRSYEDSLSQHALGGSLDNTLDISLMEPEWSADFYASGRARLMGERCIAICNNMGQTVLLGDTGSGDYATSVFSKLGYHFRDGRYLFTIDKRGTRGTSTDEPLRGFNIGVTPQPPEDHIGLNVIPADDLYFHTALRNIQGVPFERAFDKLTFRNGFGAEDEYLMLDGVAGGSHSYDDANSIGEFSANGRRWLCEIDIFNGPTMSFHNAVTVARGGLGEADVPQAAELVASAEGEGYAYTATRLPHYNGTSWTRHLLWLPGKYTFALDELTVEEEGDYSFVLGWRSLGKPRLEPGVFEATQDEVRTPGLFHEGGELVGAATDTSGKVLRHMADYEALLYRGEQEGDYVETRISVPEAGEYDLVVHTLDYTGRGIIQVSVDGQAIGQPIDDYLAGPPRRTETELDRMRLEAGDHAVRFTVVGKNPASDGYYFAICGVGLYEPGGRDEADRVARNRFRLLFPPDVPATLDHDTETLGKYLPPSPHRDQVLNIVEQTMTRALKPGEAACFQNLFHAEAGEAPRDVEFRRLNEHCALVKSGAEIVLIGIGVNGATVSLGPLEVSGKLFYIAPERVILQDATASLAGDALSAHEKPQAEPLRQALRAAWEAAEAPAGSRVDPWPDIRRLEGRWSVELPDRPLSLAAYTGPQAVCVAAGLASGKVTTVSADGSALGTFATDGPVHALCPCDLDEDGIQEMLVGSDDEHVYALGADLAELWKQKIPFLREEQIWMWWTLDSSKVRRIHADDIDGDGRPELLLGVGNMRLHCLDNTGQELWRFRTDHGICTTITTSDVFGEGKRRVLAGNGLTSSSGTCWVLDEEGNVLQRYYNGSWCTSLPAITVGDLAGDGQNTVFCGNNRGDVRAYPGVQGKAEQLWVRNLTRPIRSLTIVPAESGGLLVVGSDSGYLCAFDQAGEKAWGLPVSSAISHTALVRRGEAEPWLAAGCRDGKVFLATPEGRLVGLLDCGGRLEDAITADLDADGVDEIVVATSAPHRLHVAALGQTR